jgi:thiamine-phosphate pyrophosphorylase
MNSKKRLLKKSRIYAIIDKELSRKIPVSALARKLKDSGLDIIQFRDKISKKKDILKEAILLSKLLANSNTIFIVNDYPDIAKISDSDGIHLGQTDTPIETARRILGKDKIIGISCHNLKQAKEAQTEGADYISIGPVFPTPLKPGVKPLGLKLIKKAKKEIRIPFFAIGGINQDNIGRVLSAGARRIAVCRLVHGPGPNFQVRYLSNRLRTKNFELRTKPQ